MLQNYQKQYGHYMKRFPNNPLNVRFTQEELDNYFPNTVNIVKSISIKLTFSDGFLKNINSTNKCMINLLDVFGWRYLVVGNRFSNLCKNLTPDLNWKINTKMMMEDLSIEK